MIKKFEDYHTFEKISKSQYQEILNGGSEWHLREDYMQKKISEFDKYDINQISHLGYSLEIVKLEFDDSKYRERIALFEKGKIIPKYLITKINDEYFIVESIIFSNNRGLNDRYINEYYKCDQIDGLLDFLNQNKKNVN